MRESYERNTIIFILIPSFSSLNRAIRTQTFFSSLYSLRNGININFTDFDFKFLLLVDLSTKFRLRHKKEFRFLQSKPKKKSNRNSKRELSHTIIFCLLKLSLAKRNCIWDFPLGSSPLTTQWKFILNCVKLNCNTSNTSAKYISFLFRIRRTRRRRLIYYEIFQLFAAELPKTHDICGLSMCWWHLCRCERIRNWQREWMDAIGAPLPTIWPNCTLFVAALMQHMCSSVRLATAPLTNAIWYGISIFRKRK